MTDENEIPANGNDGTEPIRPDLRLRMAVNQEVCIGSGQCEMLAEDTFYVDEDTVIAGVIGTGLLPAELAHKLVDTCPSGPLAL